MGRKKRSVTSRHPPIFFKVSPQIFLFLRQKAFGNAGLLGTYLLMLALSWKEQMCDWTNGMIAVELGLTPRGVEKHVAELKRRGLIEIQTSPDGRRLIVPTLLVETGEITPNERSPIAPNKRSGQNSTEQPFGTIPRDKDTTHISSETGGGGFVITSNLRIKNKTQENIAPPPTENLNTLKREDTGGNGKTPNSFSAKKNSTEQAFGAIHPALQELARNIGLTTTGAVRLMAQVASEHAIGPRWLLALWENVKSSGGSQGAFVYRLKQGFDPDLVPEPDHQIPGFCPICGAEVSLRYGVHPCPEGHRLRMCHECGELAPADGVCPWCGAAPEENDADR